MDVGELTRKIAVFALPVLIGITFHEVAHGYVARMMGDDTAERMGRLSLNPLKHVDLVGTVLLPIVLLVLGSGIIFGYAKPVPVNPAQFKDPRKGMVKVATAGPGSNLAMAVLSGLAFRLIAHYYPDIAREIVSAGIYATPSGPAGYVLVPVGLMLAVSVQLNVLLLLFNLIPIPPLDGGRILMGLIPRSLEERLESFERYGMIILLLLLFVDPFGIISRLFGLMMIGLSNFLLGIPF